jgi:hypothetical protein
MNTDILWETLRDTRNFKTDKNTKKKKKKKKR